MNRTLSIFLAASLAVFLAGACAQTPTEPSTAATDRVLAAWVRVNYGTAVAPNDSGVFVLSYTQGAGASVPDSGYVFCHYQRRTLDGNIQGSNIEPLVEQLGLKTKLTDCGSDIWRVDVGSIPRGLEPVIKSLKVGGKATVALPVSQNALSYAVYNAFPSSVTENMIYEIELDGVENDIFAWQDAQLRAHSVAHYGGMDSLEDGFYFKRVNELSKTDTISDDTSVSFWYIGLRLDGRIFDTNVRDTARKYEIYTASGSYDSLTMTYYRELSTMLSNSTYVSGFTKAIHEMHRRDTVEVFFRSDWGYGASGSTNVIPEYSPLAFRIWFTNTTNEDED